MTGSSSNILGKEEFSDLRIPKLIFIFSQTNCSLKEIWQIHEVSTKLYFFLRNFYDISHKSEKKKKNFPTVFCIVRKFLKSSADNDLK